MKLARGPASSRPKPCASLKKPHESCPFATPCCPRRKKNDRGQRSAFPSETSRFAHKEVPRSTGHIMVTTRYSDQQGSKSRQKVMRLYKRWHRPITKRYIKPPLKKNQSTPRPSEHPPVMGEKMPKSFGGIKGCKYKTSSWHLNRFPDTDNIGSTV